MASSDFTCSVCKRQFTSRFTMRRHMQNIHNIVDTTECNNKNTVECNTCGRKLSCRKHLLRHMRTVHNIETDDMVRRGNKTLDCTVCNNKFVNRSSLLRHMRTVHKSATEGIAAGGVPVNTGKKRLRRLMKCAIEGCMFTCQKMKDMLGHINNLHDQHLEYQILTFNNRTELENWQDKVEAETPCKFVRKYKGSKSNRSFYYCSRSGFNRPSALVRKRHSKIQGTSKTQRTCTAHFVVSSKDNNVWIVKYLAKHFCHANVYEHLGHVRLSKKDRKWVAGKLSQNIPMDVVLRDVRANLSGQLLRTHIMTRQDIVNIRKAFRLNKPERLHANDATSVHALVISYKDESSSPIILYKRQGEAVIDICHEGTDVSVVMRCQESDFLFGFMDESQCEMLKNYGNGEMSVVCTDSTHGTNSYDFHSSTVMILDSHRQGFPVAFLYSNRQTEDVFRMFFEAIKNKAGVVNCNAFMSDMAPQFYNAWQYVMGNAKNRLYCAWHVDKSFRENTKRLIKDNAELTTQVYKQLRTLMDEQDIPTFETGMACLLDKLEGNTETAAFAKFFKLQYASCTHSWAYCYRSRCGVNTNMNLERMHDIFKHVYQQGKKNKRLDSAIYALMHMVYDKQFDRLTTLCKGKYTKKFSELRKRHAMSLTMNVITCSMPDGKEWLVRSETHVDEIYTIKKVKDSCDCQFICEPCKSCIHMFTCTCPDNATFFNMCKHIHLICRAWASQSQTVDPCQENMENMLDVQDENTNDALEIVVPDNTRRMDEVAAHVAQLSRVTSNLESNRRAAQQLHADIGFIINEVQANDHMMTILECLKSVRPKLEAVTACQYCSDKL